MATVTEGTVGIWGIASSETGNNLIIEQIEETARAERSYIRDKDGCRIGRVEYDESVEISLGGEVTSGASFAQKLNAELTIANSIQVSNLNTALAGKTLIDEVKRTRNREDWEKVTVDAEVLPFFPTGP